MNAHKRHTQPSFWADVARAFSDFLAIPTVTVLGFVVLAVGVYVLERRTVSWLEPARSFLKHHLITDPNTTNTLLGTIAGAIITVTSITFSLLLLTVQQSASALTNQVLDQFLHRRLNQLYFGIFVGVSLYALVTLATNDTKVTPVFGAAVGLLLMAIALIVLVMLVYSTLNQMRSERIIGSIHDAAIRARERQRVILARTRRQPQLTSAPASCPVRAETNGFVTGLDLDVIGKATTKARRNAEVSLRVVLGDYVCVDDLLAVVAADTDSAAREIAHVTARAISVERQRSYTGDPGYGVTQLATLGWTAISTAKSNPIPGLSSIRTLRDLLIRWCTEESDGSARNKRAKDKVPVVYHDRTVEEILDAFESLLVVSSESMQHQCAAELLHSIANVFTRLPAALQPRAERAVMTSLSTLGEQVLTSDLDAALSEVIETFRDAGRTAAATTVERARAKLNDTVGVLGSRDTRAKGAP